MAERFTQHSSLTVEEYLELEESATVRHEYVAGEIFAMVGATKRHNLIIGNVFAHLWNATRGGDCRVYAEGVKLRVAEDAIYYPDVMVACGPEGDPRVEDSPCLVVEVTSSSTETTDRREKLAAYRKTPSIRAYLIVDQERPWVERHYRDESDTWQRADLLDTGAFSVPCPKDAELSLANIYEGIFEAPGASPS